MSNREWALGRRGAGPTQECSATPLETAFVNQPFAVSDVSGLSEEHQQAEDLVVSQSFEIIS